MILVIAVCPGRAASGNHWGVIAIRAAPAWRGPSPIAAEFAVAWRGLQWHGVR